MASVLNLLQLLMLVMGCFAVVIALLTALTYPRLRSGLAALTPVQHATILRWICAAPLVGAGVLTALCLLPSLLGIVWPQFDHCLAHHGHLHLCLIHPPATLGGPLGWGVNGVFWGVVLVGMFTIARRAVAGARSLRELRLCMRYEPALGAYLVTSALPFCAVVGLTRQKIVLSAALADALPPPLLHIVLAHEVGHVRRHDSLWQLLASFLSVAHLPPLRRQLLRNLALAAERACDEHAAEVLGDRLGVARAILVVERMLADRVRVHALAPGFGGSDVAARVEALLQPPGDSRTWRVRTVGVALIAALVMLSPSSALHHWTETLLGLLVR